MGRKPKAPLSPAEAAAAIKQLVGKKDWNSDDYRAQRELIPRIPEGTPHALLMKLAAKMDPRELAELPAVFDEAIEETLEKRYAKKDANAAFVLTAQRSGGKDLRDLLTYAEGLPYAKYAKRAELVKLAKQRPDLVEGARAGLAIDGVHVVSHWLPLLVADASRESLDLIIPHVERMLKKPDHHLDWFRKEVVPLFGDTPHATTLIEMLDARVEERTKESPARAFVRKLGMTPPAIVTFTVTFRDDDDRVVYMINVDSKLATWLRARRNDKWLWRPHDVKMLAVPADATSYLLRAGKGLDRAKLDAWVQTLMP